MASFLDRSIKINAYLKNIKKLKELHD